MKPIVKSNLLIVVIILISLSYSWGQEVITGAGQPERYLPVMVGKSVGVVVNQTSVTGKDHLVDYLISKKVSVKKILVPEHGFRGESEAGEQVSSSVDVKSGLPIISLYGDKKKPTPDDLSGISLVVYDIQDVGCRFFTYVSTLYYIMDACAENQIPLLVLDRPDPNGDYIDGPILQSSMKSFVGLLPIPIVYGCTVGELALMINGEGWLTGHKKCNLTVVPVKNYSHNDRYELPVKPSPNLPNYKSVRLYPSLCLFEATHVSVGRGTEFPFQVIGYPDSTFGRFQFTPVSILGVSKHPIQENKVCYGVDLRGEKDAPQFTLSYFLSYRKKFKQPERFWSSIKWIGLLSGDPEFYQQVEKGISEDEIRKSWQPDLQKYKAMRKNYLLYPDFK